MHETLTLTALPWLWIYFGVINLVTFSVYGWDKRSARRGSRRVPEATLHGLTIAGGSPGALFGQRAFRHKTRKLWFQCIFWLIVITQCVLVIAYFRR